MGSKMLEFEKKTHGWLQVHSVLTFNLTTFALLVVLYKFVAFELQSHPVTEVLQSRYIRVIPTLLNSLL